MENYRKVLGPLMGEYHILSTLLLTDADVRQNGELGDVPLRLLEGIEQRSVALSDGLAQVLVRAFLLNHDPCGRYHSVNEAGVVQMHLLLEIDELYGILHAQHVV